MITHDEMPDIEKLLRDIGTEVPVEKVVVPLHLGQRLKYTAEDAMARHEHHVRMMALRPDGGGFRQPRTSKKRRKAAHITLASVPRAEQLYEMARMLS